MGVQIQMSNLNIFKLDTCNWIPAWFVHQLPFPLLASFTLFSSVFNFIKSATNFFALNKFSRDILIPNFFLNTINLKLDYAIQNIQGVIVLIISNWPQAWCDFSLNCTPLGSIIIANLIVHISLYQVQSVYFKEFVNKLN